MISGGGTGGHIFPAISIANEIRSRYPDADILFVGALGKMEMEKVPQAGYRIVGLPIAGFQRDKLFKNILLPFKLLKSIFISLQLIKKFSPRAVVGVGGYASGPLLLAAQLRGIPTFLQEQNSFAGKTNVWLGKRAKKICVAYPGMEAFFPSEKIVMTGNPVRTDILNIRGKARSENTAWPMAQRKLRVLVTGGSLGARNINRAVAAQLEWIAQQDLSLLWQTGENFFPQAQEKIHTLSPENVYATAFLKNMHEAYQWADVVISRAGAGAIAEITVAGKCAVLVPLPTAAEDHQTMNARSLEQAGAAALVHDNHIGEGLKDILSDLMQHPEKIQEMAAKSFALGITDATKKITDTLLADIS